MDSSEKEICLTIIARAFSESPRIHAILKKGKTEQRLRIMADYAYDLVNKYNGAYLSRDKTTVILYYRKSQYKRTFLDLLKYLRMFLLCIRPGKAISTLRREKYIQSLRPDIPDYLYVWILGSDPDKTSMRGLADIRDRLFGESKKYGLPIIIETTVERVLKLYKYVGFEVYHEIFDETIQMPVWFLRR